MPLPQKKTHSGEAHSLKEACNGEAHPLREHLCADAGVTHDGHVQRPPRECTQNSTERESMDSAPMSNKVARHSMTEPAVRVSSWNPKEHVLRDVATAGGATVRGDFKQLLTRLDEQHAWELSSLQTKINRLNSELRSMRQKGFPSGRQDGESYPCSARSSVYSVQRQGEFNDNDSAASIECDSALGNEADSVVGNEGHSVVSTKGEPGTGNGISSIRFNGLNGGIPGTQSEELKMGSKERTGFRKTRNFGQMWAIRSEWQESNRPLGGSLYDFEQDEVTTNLPRLSMAEGKASDDGHGTLLGKYSCLVIHPASSGATFWNALTFCVVMYDLMTIPLQVFDPPSNWFWDVTGWFTQIYWNIDLCFSFFFGFYDKGVVVLDFARTCKHYLKTWFTLDVAIVSFDWMLFALGRHETSSAGFSRFGKTLRGLKFLRVIRLLKTAKVMHASENFQDLMSSDFMQHFSVLKMLMIVILLNHLVACLWYAVGDTTDGSGWVERDEVVDWGFFQRYITCHHWAITQLGVGGSFHTPYNTAELVSSSLILLVGILVLSSVISSVTNSVAALHERKANQLQQFRLFRRFCRDYQIPVYLTRRVRTFLLYKIDYDQRKTQIEQITMFSLLSESLLSEIHESMFAPALETNGFIKTLKACSVPGMVRRIAARAIIEAHVGSQDILFSRGEVAVRAFVTCSGVLEYEWPYSDRFVLQDRYQWVGQPCLWIHGWLHAGKLKAQEESEILCLELEPFSEAVNTHGQAWEVAHMFAKMFLERMTGESEDCSDLFDIVFFDHDMSSAAKVAVVANAHDHEKVQSKCCCWS